MQMHFLGYVPVSSSFSTGLSASGLRSIRYAKEIPDLDFVVANDMLPAGRHDFYLRILSRIAYDPLTAVESIQRNVLFNDIPTGKVIPSLGDVNKVNIAIHFSWFPFCYLHLDSS
jgi:tRNA G26 N,N-dimethylase Trm1